MKRLSFSKAELARHCRYWLRAEVRWTAGDSDYARGGNVVHGLLAAIVRGAPVAVPADPELRAMFAHARAWLDARRKRTVSGAIGERSELPLGVRAEIAFAYDTAGRTARELVDPAGCEGTRWYADPELRAAYAGPGGAVRDTEICGRIDLHSMAAIDAEGAMAVIYDYKFHFGPEGADAEAQLALCSLGISRAFGVDRVRAVAVHVWADRPPVEEPHEFCEEDFLDLEDELADLAAAPPGAPHEGPWCIERHCDAAANCPVATRAAGELASLIPVERLARREEYSLAKPITAETSNDEGAWAIVAIGLVKKVLEAREAEAKALADVAKGLTLDGKVYSGQTHPMEKPDLEVPGAIEALGALGYGLEFAIKPTTSWAAIKEVAGDAGEVAETQAREALRAIGALKVSEQTAYRWRNIDGGKRKPAKKLGVPANDTRKAS